MRLVFATALCLAALFNSTLAQAPSLQTFTPPTTPQRTAPTPETPVTLDEFIKALRSYTERRLMNMDYRPQSNPSYVQTARMDLAHSPYIREVAAGIFQDLDRLAAADQSAAKAQDEKRKKDQNKKINVPARNENPYNRMPMPTPITKFEPPFAAVQKAGEESDARRAATKKSIATRLESLEKQLTTPVGQQFALARTSALFKAIASPLALGVIPASNTTFEVVSNSDGGFIAYRTTLQRVPAAAEDDPSKIMNGPNGPYKEVRVASKDKSYFVRGYTKPVSIGEYIRLKVRPGNKVTINNVELLEYIVVEE